LIGATLEHIRVLILSFAQHKLGDALKVRLHS